jgi:hypothetical protein
MSLVICVTHSGLIFIDMRKFLIARFRMGSHWLNVEMGRLMAYPAVRDFVHVVIDQKLKMRCIYWYALCMTTYTIILTCLLSNFCVFNFTVESWTCICAPTWTLALPMMRLCRPIVSGTNLLLIWLRANIVVMISCQKYPIVWVPFFLLFSPWYGCIQTCARKATSINRTSIKKSYTSSKTAPMNVSNACRHEYP